MKAAFITIHVGLNSDFVLPKLTIVTYYCKNNEV